VMTSPAANCSSPNLDVWKLAIGMLLCALRPVKPGTS
jgi:hypothetical protein